MAKNKMKIIKGLPKIFWILVIGFLIRIILSPFGTLNLDQNTFIAWSNSLNQSGFAHFYDGWSDYLPGYLYILWFLGRVRGIIPDVLLYKLPAIFADILTGFLIYKIVYKLKNPKWGLITSALYIFNPAVIANSTLWGQVDSLTALFALLTIWLLDINPFFSAASFALGTLIKPQTAFIAPLVLIFAVKDKWKVQKTVSYMFISLVIFVLAFIPFNNQGNIFVFIMQRFQVTFSQYPYGSVNAFNFWGIFGFWHSDIFTKYVGYLLVLAGYLLITALVFKKRISKYACAGLIFLFTFLFLTRMHERHLLPVFAPLVISLSVFPGLIIPYIGLSITYLANLYFSYNWVSRDFLQVFSVMVNKLFIIINLALFGFTFWRILSKSGLKIPKLFFGPVKKHVFSKIKMRSKTSVILLSLILFFSAVTRISWLGSPPNEYFDEVYHAFTARQILHGNKMAWEWWNPNPEGFAYEWTHPPLAKLGMVLGMRIFGENSFGWRIPGAILGVGIVYLVYRIAKELFDDEMAALLSAAVFSLDGLALVMNRIGMNDSYLLFFSLLSLYFFLKQKDLLSAASFGLALSSKWSAIWLIPIFFIFWLKRKNKFRLSILWFLILPFVTYLLSYLPMFLSGHGFDIWWGMQKQMWWYHTGLRATHPYTSPWWSWPILLRPIYLYTSSEIGGMVSRIYAMGNPVVFWFGLISVVLCFVYSYLERNKNLGFVVFAYLIFFVTWAASPRIMFLYHYLPSIPFLAIATAYVLRRNPKVIFAYLLICLLSFIYFYPHWAGLKIPLWLDTSYYWFSSWR